MNNQTITKAQPHMPIRPDEGSWEFPSIVDLYKALSAPDDKRDALTPRGEGVATGRVDPLPNGGRPEGPVGLGDFTRIWDFLGVSHTTDGSGPLDGSSAATEGTREPIIPIQSLSKLDYTSDGAIYRAPSTKGVRWRDEVGVSGLEESGPDDTRATDSGDLLGTSPETDTDTVVTASRRAERAQKEKKKKTKSQRKKENRRLRREAQLREVTQKARFLSDADSDADRASAPAAKASKHVIPSTPVGGPLGGGYNLRPMPHRNAASEPRMHTRATPEQMKVLRELVGVDATPSKPPKGASVVASAAATVASIALPITPKRETKHGRGIGGDAIQFTPASVRPTLADALKAKAQQLAAPEEPDSELSSSPPNTTPYYTYLQRKPYADVGLPAAPLTPQARPARKRPGDFVIRHGEDRHYHFLLKLIQNFGADRKWLVAPTQMVNHATSPSGIHVFVDASNIFIGFADALKALQGIPRHAHARPPAPISFDALVLLLERRRPVAKRVLVGSLPLNPAFETARLVGYETSLLEQVYKDKELSKYQKRALYSQRNGAGATASDSAPATTTAAATAAASDALTAPRWTEQGVDEILHLKILESVVDHADAPSTIVLATGDAAAAEFSAGFLAMAERALARGWRVELVAWRAGISPRYRSAEWAGRWGGRFAVVELDEYVAELLDT